jgi:hypothetical protein
MEYKNYWDIPDDCSEDAAREIFKEIYDAEFNDLRKQHPNYTEDLYIESKRYQMRFREFVVSRQIKKTWYLKFLDQQEKRISRKREFSWQELGLLAYYNGEVIRKGEDAYNWFIHYCDEDNRRHNFTKEMAKNQIKRIEKLLPKIKKSELERVNYELKNIRSDLDKGLFGK